METLLAEQKGNLRGLALGWMKENLSEPYLASVREIPLGLM
jgi:hypothetical protein